LQQVAGGGKAFPVKSTDFYRQILGISFPWKIVNVELDMEAKRVVITAEVDRTTKWGHPETKRAASLHKWAERTWRHLDTCQFETVIIWLQACCNVTKMMEVMRPDWQTVHKIMKAAVERGLLRRGDAFIEHGGVSLGHRHRLTLGERPQRDAGQRQQAHGDDREQDHQRERHHEGEAFVAASPGGLTGPERLSGRLRIFQLFAQRMEVDFLMEGARTTRRFPANKTSAHLHR
jgi:hypothetical protein